MVKGLHPPRPDAETTGSSEAVGSGIERKESTRRAKSDHLQWESGEKERVTTKSSELVCFYTNARNLLNKMDQLETWVHDLDPDIIGITESWASSEVLDSELALSGYDMFRKDRPVTRSGGGVLLYIKSKLNAVESPPSSNFPEQLWCYFLDASQVKCCVGICYRTPSTDIYGSPNHDLLQDMISELNTSKKHFVLMGDFNYRYLSWPPLHLGSDTAKEALEFFNCLEDNFFTQHVRIPTRNDAILDLVITDEPYMVSDLVELGSLAGCDHNSLLWKLEAKTTHESSDRLVFDYVKADIDSMRKDLQSVDWVNQIGCLSAEQDWLWFKDRLELLQRKYIPLVRLHQKRAKPKWMTHKALKAVKHRRAVYRKYKDSTHPTCIQASKRATSIIKQAKWNFEKQLATKIKEDHKSFFAYARSKSKSNVRVGALENGHGQLITNAQEKAEVLNDFFSSVFTKEDVSDIPVPDSCFTGSSSDRLCDIDVNCATIADKLSKLRSDKAPGDDNLSPRLIRALSNEIAVPISLIFRKSLDTSCVPRDWRTAIISPLFKKGRRSQPDNYRPVSLTSQIVKVVESIIRDEIVQHLDKFNLIHQSQHGFRSGYSCSSNLLSFLESVSANVDAKLNVDTVYLDFAKAFDKVPHERLLRKLKAHGIDGIVCNWIASWLKHR